MGLEGLVKLLTAPWVVLGPLNMFKVAWINRGSPVAKYIVVEPAEVCQANCKIARMWAVLFWGLQTVVALGVLRGGIERKTAASAKAVVGATLVAAYVENVVREPVAAAGGVELCCALLLVADELGGVARRTKALVKRYGAVGFAVHWICYAATILAFYVALGRGVDVATYARQIPFVGDNVAASIADYDTTRGLARWTVAWSMALATAPLRLVTDIILTLTLGTLLCRTRDDKSKTA